MKTAVIALAFFVGFLFCLKYRHRDLVEGFDKVAVKKDLYYPEKDDDENVNCPNLLVKRGKEIFLLNKRKAIIPGVNPIRFDNLEQYAEYLKWQRRVGVRCPVLFFEEAYNAQNKKIWRFADDPFDTQGGLPPTDVMGGMGDAQIGKLLDAAIDTNPPYNQGEYASFDPENQNIGKFTPLDKLYHSPNEFSDNPMDSNWTGRGIPIGGDTVNRMRSPPDETSGKPTDNNWNGTINSDETWEESVNRLKSERNAYAQNGEEWVNYQF